MLVFGLFPVENQKAFGKIRQKTTDIWVKIENSGKILNSLSDVCYTQIKTHTNGM